jgi:hypothetical protein
MRESLIRGRLAPALIIAVAMACPGGRTRTPREDPGRFLASVGVFYAAATLAWAQDGSALTFPQSNRITTSLVKVDLQGTILKTFPEREELILGGPASTADGSAIYYIAGSSVPGPGFSYLVREAVSNTVITTDDLFVDLLVLSPDERKLLFRGSRSPVLVLDLAQRTTTSVDCVYPLNAVPVFSPSSAEVLCTASPRAPPEVVDFTTGARRALNLGAMTSWLAAHWSEELGLRLVGRVSNDQGRLAIVDTATGVHRDLGPASSVLLPVVSRDGRELAFWEQECLDPYFLGFGEACHPTEIRLVVVDLTTGAARRIASSEAWGGPIAFSPDGRQVACQYGMALYVRPTGI